MSHPYGDLAWSKGKFTIVAAICQEVTFVIFLGLDHKLHFSQPAQEEPGYFGALLTSTGLAEEPKKRAPIDPSARFMAGACMVRAPVLEVPDFKGFRRDGLKAAPWFYVGKRTGPTKTGRQEQATTNNNQQEGEEEEERAGLSFFLSARDGFWGICRRLLSGERGLRCFADAPARRSFGWSRNSQNSLGLRGGCLSECTWSSWKGRCLETCRTLGEAREDSCFQGLGVFVEGLVSHVYSCNSAWVHLIHLDAKKY